jgi:branched-chain amino acid transport system ATP-binding protein
VRDRSSADVGSQLLLHGRAFGGLAPVVVQQVFELVKSHPFRRSSRWWIVEQNVQHVLRVVDRAYLLEAGNIRASGTSA